MVGRRLNVGRRRVLIWFGFPHTCLFICFSQPEATLAIPTSCFFVLALFDLNRFLSFAVWIPTCQWSDEDPILALVVWLRLVILKNVLLSCLRFGLALWVTSLNFLSSSMQWRWHFSDVLVLVPTVLPCRYFFFSQRLVIVVNLSEFLNKST